MEIEEIATYGSLISATDPVSVLAIFRAMGADKTLYNLVCRMYIYIYIYIGVWGKCVQ